MYSQLIISSVCIIGNRHWPNFSPLHHTDSFAVTSLLMQGSEFGKTNAHDVFSRVG